MYIMKKNILIGKSLIEVLSLMGTYPLTIEELNKEIQGMRPCEKTLEKWFPRLVREHTAYWVKNIHEAKDACAEAGYLSHEATLADRDESIYRIKYEYVKSSKYKEDFNKTYYMLKYFLGDVSYGDMSRVMYYNDDSWSLDLHGIFCYISFRLKHRVERNTIVETIVERLWEESYKY